MDITFYLESLTHIILVLSRDNSRTIYVKS